MQILVFLFIFTQLIFYIESIFWIVTTFFSGIYGVIHFIFFAAFFTFLVKNRNAILFHKNEKGRMFLLLLIVFIAGLQLHSSYVWDIAIVGVIALYISPFCTFLAFYRFTRKYLLVKSILMLFFSIPVAYYVNVIIGPTFREFYAWSVFLALKSFGTAAVQKTDSFIILGERFVNIDAACSGIRNMLLLGYFMTAFLSFKNEGLLVISKLVGQMMLIFVVLNVIHLIAVSYVFLVPKWTDITPGHEFLGFLVSLLALSLTISSYYRRNER